MRGNLSSNRRSCAATGEQALWMGQLTRHKEVRSDGLASQRATCSVRSGGSDSKHAGLAASSVPYVSSGTPPSAAGEATAAALAASLSAFSAVNASRTSLVAALPGLAAAPAHHHCISLIYQ